MQPEARCLLLVLFVCIVNLSNIVGVPPSASAGRRCLSKADAKVRTFSRTRKLFGDFFCKKGDFGAFFDLGQGHGEGIHIIYICAQEGWTSPAAELRGTGRKGRDERRRRDGGDGRETEPRSKTAGHSGYNGRGTGDGQAPQPSCGEQDGRGWTGGAGRDGEGWMDLIRWAEVIRAACVW